MTLLRDLYAFLEEHRRCGELDATLEEFAPEEWRIRFGCTCDAAMTRSAAPTSPETADAAASARHYTDLGTPTAGSSTV